MQLNTHIYIFVYVRMHFVYGCTVLQFQSYVRTWFRDFSQMTCGEEKKILRRTWNYPFSLPFSVLCFEACLKTITNNYPVLR
jgi:hypothetical protein